MPSFDGAGYLIEQVGMHSYLCSSGFVEYSTMEAAVPYHREATL
jgi:hypothetical protein